LGESRYRPSPAQHEDRGDEINDGKINRGRMLPIQACSRVTKRLRNIHKCARWLRPAMARPVKKSGAATGSASCSSRVVLNYIPPPPPDEPPPEDPPPEADPPRLPPPESVPPAPPPPNEPLGVVGTMLLLPVAPVVPVVLVPTLLPPVAPGVVLLSVPAEPDPLSMLLPPVAPGVVLLSVPAPVVLLPLPSELPPLVPGVVLPSAPLPVASLLLSGSLSVQLPAAPLPLQLTLGVVVIGWPGAFCASAAAGMQSVARDKARILIFMDLLLLET
jgi:hypothetical protein